MGAKMGSVSPGHYADLVVLNSNPLEDIRNTSDIKMVFKNGIQYSSDPTKRSVSR
jgi:imidazolonepropionase-like amidohydrolase